MTSQIAVFLIACMLSGCATRADKVDTAPDATPFAATVRAYKVIIAERISQVNSIQVHTARPQALLRSVVVVKFSIDGGGNLLRSEILRGNHDGTTEATALATLKRAAPFPKPASHLLIRGRLELSESWLFNTDGRFQLRSIAQAQMDE